MTRSDEGRDSIELFVRVTDPHLDAPDGSVLTFPNGLAYERHGDEWVALHLCEGITARWCPTHGACICASDELDDAACPLHSPTSTHGSVTVGKVLA